MRNLSDEEKSAVAGILLALILMAILVVEFILVARDLLFYKFLF